jgi:protocatechuate 3,4-dioxygenase beta subunit
VRRARVAALALAIVGVAIGSVSADPVPRSGAVLAGRVVDARGAPVARVPVELFEAPYGGFVNGTDWRPIVPAPEWWAPAREVKPIAVATSGPDGRWRFEGLDPTVRCRARVKPADGRASDEVVTYPSTPYDSVDLVLRADEPVTLLATDAVGTPISADVVARGGGDFSTEVSSPTQVFRTGADGRVRLVGLPTGFVDLDVRVAGKAVIRTLVKVPAPKEVVVRVGDPSGATAGGTVTDPAGAPIPGAHVVVATRQGKANETGADSLLLATTDAKGSWRLVGLPPGVFLGLSVAADGFVAATGIDARRRVAAKDALAFVTVLGRTGGAEGRVLGPDGRAFPGVQVWIEERATGTDASGRWRLDGLEAGPKEVRVRAAGYYLENSPAATGWDPGGGSWVNVRAGALTTAPDISLRRGVRVEGQVVDEGGKPVAGATVFAWSGRAGLGRWEHRREAAVSTSAADGTFVLDGLVPGDDWALSVRTAGSASDDAAEASLHDSGRPVRADVTVRRLARIAGRTVDLGNRPAPGVEIELIGPERRVVRSDAEGRFDVRDLKSGAYRIEPTYGERPHRERPGISASVGPGEATDVLFSFDPPRAIAGIVVDEKGEPAAGVSVSLKADEPWQFSDRWLGEEAWWSWGTGTDAAGRFRIENLWPGGYWVRPSGGRGPVEAGTEDLRLVWYRDAVPDIAGPEDSMRGMNRWEIAGDAVPIEGTVLGPDGLPVPSAVASITVHSADGLRGFTAPVVAGRWRSTVRSGADTVDVEAKRACDASGEPLDFGPGKATGLKVDVGHVEIRMTKGRSITGRVVDADGRPVAGAAVFASQAGGGTFTGSAGTTATDARGAFRFVGFPDGEFKISSAPAPGATLAERVVAAGATDVELRYPRMQWIEGRLMDEASRPIVGFGLTTDGARTRTSFDGTFRIGPVEGSVVLKGPEKWVYSSNEVSRPVYGRVESPPIAAGTVGVELRAPQVCEVSGVVVFGDGVEEGLDVEVRLDPEPADPKREPLTTRQPSSEDGFRLAAPPGRWRLTATSKSWNGRDYTVHTTSVVVTCPSAGLTITLENAQGVRGSLVGEDAAGFLVSFVAAGEPGPSTAGIASGEDGTFQWPTKEAGPFLVFASRVGDDRFALAEGVHSGAPGLTLTLAAGQRIDGRLEGFGSPFDRTKASVWAQSTRGLVVHGEIANDGTFSLRGLPPAETWTVEVRALDGKDLRSGAALGVASGTRDLIVKPVP